MRGDSLRDFYAKTLALLGLALVGALGALVDYWPATQPLPRISEPLPAPAPAGIAARADTAVADVTALLAAPRPAVKHSSVVRREARPTSLSVRMASARDVLGASHPVALQAPAPSVRSIPVRPVTSLHAVNVALVAPELTPEPPVMLFAQHGSGHGAADQGLLTDATEAAKKAGTSIMSGTVKTGASIVGGLRSVGGVVRRGLWRFAP